MGVVSEIAYYVMDGDQRLTAEFVGNTIYFLYYGRDPIGEKTTD